MPYLDVPDRDPNNLTPELRLKWLELKRRMAQLGHPMKLVEGRRSSERQDWLFQQGRSRPGKIVTYAPAGRGKHEPGEDGLGRAFDAVFMDPEPYAERHPWALYGEQAKLLGLRWGGDWKRPDRPHCELA